MSSLITFEHSSSPIAAASSPCRRRRTQCLPGLALLSLLAVIPACGSGDSSTVAPVAEKTDLPSAESEPRVAAAAEQGAAPAAASSSTPPRPVATGAGNAAGAAGAIAADASGASGLDAGVAAPVAPLRTVDGAEFDLAATYADGPVVLVFYRGGWCPYCTKHLRELGAMEASLRERGFTILAVSPDRPEKLQATRDEHAVGFTLLSDQDLALARAFGLAFRVDDETVRRYEGFGIDLQAASGRDHQSLPVPAVYLIDRDGIIRFAHSDPDYRARLDEAALRAAAEQLASSAAGDGSSGAASPVEKDPS